MDYEKLADNAKMQKTISALKERGITATIVKTRKEALEKLKSLIPAGSEIMTGGSTTLEEIGFVDLLKKGNHEWINLKDKILAEKNPEKQAELRKKSVISEYFIGSVHAVTQNGEVLTASASGSQIGPYAFTSNNIIWIVGAQKIVPSLEKGLERIKEHCLPLEDKRMKSIGYPGSTIGKILIFEREIIPNRKINLVFVEEKLGF